MPPRGALKKPRRMPERVVPKPVRNIVPGEKSLTAKEREALELICRQGMKCRDVAAQMRINIRTLETRLRNARAKLGAYRTYQLGFLYSEFLRSEDDDGTTVRH